MHKWCTARPSSKKPLDKLVLGLHKKEMLGHTVHTVFDIGPLRQRDVPRRALYDSREMATLERQKVNISGRPSPPALEWCDP